mgnify:CR=1 FL=1
MCWAALSSSSVSSLSDSDKSVSKSFLVSEVCSTAVVVMASSCGSDFKLRSGSSDDSDLVAVVDITGTSSSSDDDENESTIQRS